MDLATGKHYLFRLKELGDYRGGMIALSSGTNMPFLIQRVFCNYKTISDAIRGNHANKFSNFVMVSVCGSCTVEVDEGSRVTEYQLDNPNTALFVGRGVWKTMRNFSADNVLLVFSDCEYDPDEYISDYNEYIDQTK